VGDTTLQENSVVYPTAKAIEECLEFEVFLQVNPQVASRCMYSIKNILHDDYQGKGPSKQTFEDLIMMDIWHSPNTELASKGIKKGGFKCEFSNFAMHGPGTYFSERLNYSLHPKYAHILDRTKDSVKFSVFAGRL
jgi:hypothetical protein